MPLDIEIIGDQHREAVSLQSFYQGSDINQGFVDSDDWKFTSQATSRTDLPKITQGRQITVSTYLYQSNPFAHRYIELLTAFTMGEGPMLIAADANVQHLLNEFWENHHNQWPNRSIQYSRDLAIHGDNTFTFGELYTSDRIPIIGVQYVNPLDVKHVLPSKKDKFTMDKIILHKRALGVKTQDDPALRISLLRDEQDQNGIRRLVGDGVFHRINNMSDSTRGISDLFPLSDWLQLYNEYQFNLGERLNHMTMYFFDVVFKDASKEEIREFKRNLLLDPPKPGSMIVHNDRVEMSPKSVELGGADLVDVGNSFFGTIITGLGFPSHWTGMAGGGGRTAAEASHDPVFRHFLLRQGQIRRNLSEIIRYQIDIAIGSGMETVTNEKFKLVFPKLGIRDFQRAGGAAARIAQALRDTVEVGLIDKATASELILLAFEQVGLNKQEFVAATKEGENPVATTESIHINESHTTREVLSGIENAVDTVIADGKLPSGKDSEMIKNELYRLITFHTIEE